MEPILTWQVKSVKYTHRLSRLPAENWPALYAGDPPRFLPPPAPSFRGVDGGVGAASLSQTNHM